MLGEFKTFAVRGNLIDLAVAFVMGVAFTTLVNSFVEDILMPLVAAIFGATDFSALTVSLNNSEIRYGAFLTAAIIFTQIAIALFLLVKFVSKLRRENEEQEIITPPEDVLLLREIRDVLVTGSQASHVDADTAT